LNDGTITFTADATDDVGNTASDTETATKDTAIAVTLDNVTDPINATNQGSVAVDGTTDDDANSVTVKASDGVNPDVSAPATVGGGLWSATLDVSSLNDGTITFTVTATDAAANTATDSETATKDTAISVTVDNVTDPINSSNETNVGADGTTDDDANTVKVTVSDGVNPPLGPFTATVSGGLWSVSGIDASSLNDTATITFEATATDAAGNTAIASKNANKDTSVAVSVDNVTDPITQANETSVSADGTTDNDTNSVKVTVSDGVNPPLGPFTATVGGGLWSVSGIDVSSLNDGTITYTAKATDTAGNDTTASQNALKDTTVAVSITTVTDPVTSGNQTNVGASGTSDAGTNTVGVTVSDGVNPPLGPFAATVAPDGSWSVTGIDVSSLNDGTITFEATATDTVGNTATDDETATKDATAPAGLFLESPADGSSVNTNTPTLEWSDASDPNGPVTYTLQYVVDSGSCDFTGATTVSGLAVSSHQPTLADGDYCWRVKAADNYGNETAYTAAWKLTVDATAPDTVIDTFDPATSPTNQTSASFTFHSTEPLGSLECKLDAGAWTNCDSGSQSYAGPLGDGSHTFQVRATDAALNTDPTPDSYTWVVDTAVPDTIIDTNPPDPSSTDSAAFTFHSTEPLGSLECKLDSGAWTNCDSGTASYTGLANGSHTFQVRATDQAGNTDTTPDSYTWMVNVVGASSNCALCVLSPTGTGLELTGNAIVNVDGKVVVNSTANGAAKVGGNARLIATGTISGPAAPSGFQRTGNGVYSPTPTNGAAATDPYAGVAMCPAAGAICPTTVKSDAKVKDVGVTITPGIFNTIEVTGNGTLTFSPGVYVIKKAFKVSGNATVYGTGVTLYFACSTYPSGCAAGKAGGVFEFTGNGAMAITPPASGAFAGITIFYDRNNTATGKYSGNTTGFGGAIYMRAARFEMTGNGGTIRSRVIANAVKLSGNSALTIDP
jgi:hypothetical protein